MSEERVRETHTHIHTYTHTHTQRKRMDVYRVKSIEGGKMDEAKKSEGIDSWKGRQWKEKRGRED